MRITPYKSPLVHNGDDLYAVLRQTLPAQLPEKTVLLLASKIPATCEGRFVAKDPNNPTQKQELIQREAEYFLPPDQSKYHLMLTIKHNWMFASAGIDESNADNQYLLWPTNPQQTAVEVWQWLRSTYGTSHCGVIITDSHSIPLSWGVVGHGIAYCGFTALRSYVNQPDLFGRPLQMEQSNIVQCLASSAALVMGEGAEQTPVALVTELEQLVEFTETPPTQRELQEQVISIEDDIYAPLLNSVSWQKGGGDNKSDMSK